MAEIQIKTKLRRLRLERKEPVWLTAKKAGIGAGTLVHVENLEQRAGAAVRAAMAKYFELPEAELFDPDGYAKEVE